MIPNMEAAQTEGHAQAKDEYSYELQVPKERVGVLVGKNGSVKKELEGHTKTKITVTPDGDVTIIGTDALLLYDAREAVLAIGRGFNPEIAQQLLSGDVVMETIEVKEYAGKNKAAEMRILGRVIGSEGKAKREIEHLTGTHISIYEKHVAIIGDVEHATDARRAIEMLLRGAMHATVYRFLEKKRRGWGKVKGF